MSDPDPVPESAPGSGRLWDWAGSTEESPDVRGYPRRDREDANVVRVQRGRSKKLNTLSIAHLGCMSKNVGATVELK